MKSRMAFFMLFLLCPLLSHAMSSNTDLVLTGRIISKTCDVASDSTDQTVDMGDVDNRQFSQAGAMASPVTFAIHFTHCGSLAKSMGLGFWGTQTPQNNNILAMDPGSAANVGIALYNADGSTVPLNPDLTLPQYALTPGIDNTLSFRARYVALSSPVTPGIANATATFTIEWP